MFKLHMFYKYSGLTDPLNDVTDPLRYCRKLTFPWYPGLTDPLNGLTDPLNVQIAYVLQVFRLNGSVKWLNGSINGFTKDAYLVDARDERRSRWLLKNCTFIRLPAGETFYDKTKVPSGGLDNRFSLFAQTVKRRRLSVD